MCPDAAKNFRLHGIGILKLIDEDVRVSLAEILASIGIIQQPSCAQKQIQEVELA
jgi:hypothetical protein